MPLSTILTLIGTFKEQLIEAVVDAKEEVEFFLKDGLPTYIDSIESKFENTKTFLYRNDMVPFSAVFFPVSLRNSHEKRKVTTYNDLFGRSNYVTINGTAGSGKTMLMKHFFLTSIKDYYKIPIYIELRSLNEYDGNFMDFLYDVIFNSRLTRTKKILERLLESGSFILLLDGYDEIYSDRKSKFTTDLDKFIDRYAKNNFVISSRVGSGLEAFPRFSNYFVEELADEEIFEFTDVVLSIHSNKELAEKIKLVIKNSATGDYASLLKNPLLLSMFILTFNTYPELPKLRSKLYWNLIDTLINKHNEITKTGEYVYERKTALKKGQFEKVLGWLSYISLFQGKYTFDAEYFNLTLDKIKQELGYDFSTRDLIKDLTLAVPIILIDGLNYKFPHKSIQEYFSSKFIKEQSEETKKIIYEKKFVERMQAGGFAEDSFWNFCYEIDKIAFIKFFLLPKLLDFKKWVFNEDAVTQLKNYYSKIDGNGAYAFFSLDIRTISFRRRASVYTFDLYTDIFRFLNIEGIRTISVKGWSFDSHEYNMYFEEMRRRFGDKEYSDYYRYDFIGNWCNEATDLMYKLGFVETLTNIRRQVEQKIITFQEEISKERLSSNSLLGL